MIYYKKQAKARRHRDWVIFSSTELIWFPLSCNCTGTLLYKYSPLSSLFTFSFSHSFILSLLCVIYFSIPCNFTSLLPSIWFDTNPWGTGVLPQPWTLTSTYAAYWSSPLFSSDRIILSLVQYSSSIVLLPAFVFPYCYSSTSSSSYARKVFQLLCLNLFIFDFSFSSLLFCVPDFILLQLSAHWVPLFSLISYHFLPD